MLNKACRIVMGTFQSTPLQALYRITTIAPPNIQRHVATRKEGYKQSLDPRHPLHEHIAPSSHKNLIKTPVWKIVTSNRTIETMGQNRPFPVSRYPLFLRTHPN